MPVTPSSEAGPRDQWLLLWDIDGTLLQRATAEHVAAVWQAMRDVHDLTETPKLMERGRAGMTDGQIIREILLASGVSEEQINARTADVQALTCELFDPSDLSEHRVDRIEQVLQRMHELSGVHQALVTGNFEQVAYAKLDAAGLGGWFDRELRGGFGSDHEHRSLLPGFARERAGARLLGEGEVWPADRAIVIGDTPRDIECARADGCYVIAVTTGPHEHHELLEADAVATDADELLVALERLMQTTRLER